MSYDMLFVAAGCGEGSSNTNGLDHPAELRSMILDPTDVVELDPTNPDGLMIKIAATCNSIQPFGVASCMRHSSNSC